MALSRLSMAIKHMIRGFVAISEGANSAEKASFHQAPKESRFLRVANASNALSSHNVFELWFAEKGAA